MTPEKSPLVARMVSTREARLAVEAHHFTDTGGLTYEVKPGALHGRVRFQTKAKDLAREVHERPNIILSVDFRGEDGESYRYTARIRDSLFLPREDTNCLFHQGYDLEAFEADYSIGVMNDSRDTQTLQFSNHEPVDIRYKYASMFFNLRVEGDELKFLSRIYAAEAFANYIVVSYALPLADFLWQTWDYETPEGDVEETDYVNLTTLEAGAVEGLAPSPVRRVETT